MNYSTQNDLLLKNLQTFYDKDNNLDRMLEIINGRSKTSLRIVDWFATNYAKKHYIVYNLQRDKNQRFKVYSDYKLRLKAYSKRRFDPFCRWERITIPYKNNTSIVVQKAEEPKYTTHIREMEFRTVPHKSRRHMDITALRLKSRGAPSIGYQVKKPVR